MIFDGGFVLRNDDALAVSVGRMAGGGGSSVNVTSSIQTDPRPPLPAVTTISIRDNIVGSTAPPGPHAKEKCRFFNVMRFHS